MEKSFENFKNYILINAKEKDACSSQIKEAETTINFTQLLGVIKNNANWCYVNKLVKRNYNPNKYIHCKEIKDDIYLFIIGKL